MLYSYWVFKVHIKVNGSANAGVTESSAEVILELGSRLDSNTRYHAYILPRVRKKKMPERLLCELHFPKSKNLTLADPSCFGVLLNLNPYLNAQEKVIRLGGRLRAAWFYYIGNAKCSCQYSTWWRRAHVKFHSQKVLNY